MEGLGDPKASPIDPKNPSQNQELAYALDLFNHGFYWESHVYFEAIWNTHGRIGPISDLMKAFIKLGAAGVKLSIDQKIAAIGHFERARELLQDVISSEGNHFLGFNLQILLEKIDNFLGGDHQIFDIHPDW